MDYAQLRDINDAAVRINSTKGVTGLLIYGQSSFLQILEGARAEISETFHRIAHDKRHHELVLIGVSEIAERSFQDWAMRCVMIDGVNGTKTATLLMKFGVSDHFRPALFSDSSAHGFLLAHSREFAA
jgi:hypothetical protein